MIQKKEWSEFRKSGLLFIINQMLHIFGWAIVFEIEDDNVKNVYPARVKFRGFDESNTTKGYEQITKYIKDIGYELDNEVNNKK